jgi:hypothetical protein
MKTEQIRSEKEGTRLLFRKEVRADRDRRNAQEFTRLANDSGLSQTRIAELLGVTLTHINGILTGRSVPSEALVRSFRAHVVQAQKIDPRLVEADAVIRALPKGSRERTLQLISLLIAQVKQSTPKGSVK